jgi:uncharacterized membrane protein
MGLFNKTKKFIFNNEEEVEIVKAIDEAENKTSGEIRIHVEAVCKGDSFERAKVLFKELGVDRTRLRNGVLFYLAYESHKFAIYADEGINQVVPENFWVEMKDMMAEHFKKSAFLSGLKAAIQLSGEQLKQHFPHSGAHDQDELENELSKN